MVELENIGLERIEIACYCICFELINKVENSRLLSGNFMIIVLSN